MVSNKVHVLFFFKQKTAYEMRISDWSSDVCSSDLQLQQVAEQEGRQAPLEDRLVPAEQHAEPEQARQVDEGVADQHGDGRRQHVAVPAAFGEPAAGSGGEDVADQVAAGRPGHVGEAERSEEHTSELQSLMRTSYAVF